MFFNRKEKKYSVLYKNQIGSLDVGVFSIIGTKRDLRNRLEKKGIFVQKIIDLETIMSSAKELTINDQDLFNFTRYFRLELSKGADSIVSPKDALKEVYKKTFNPLVYAILYEVENNRKFQNVIDDYPNIFNDIYRATIRGYFGDKHQPIKGLIKLEEYIKEKQEFKKKVIDKTRMSIITILLIVILSYVLDGVIYEMIKENFITYGRDLPDFTEFYHNSLYFIVKYIGVFFITIGLLIGFYNLVQNDKLKTLLGKIKFTIPFYGAIHRKKSIFDIIDTFIIMRESDVRQRDLLTILAQSANNYYFKRVIFEVREEIKTGKQIGNSFEEFGIFNGTDEDVIHAFKSSNIDEAMISLRDVKKVELDDLTSKTLRTLTSAMLILTLVMGISMGYAYYKPVQMQSTLVKDKIKADKEAALENN